MLATTTYFVAFTSARPTPASKGGKLVAVPARRAAAADRGAGEAA
ncbi:MAG TPA: hypothetical protein VHG32_17720 [Thermoanaerobaculia bacterium]|nr:hypothetical protein [Thermoanaerobaculia bacterium]